ncbi:(deoxy)nucleoside triphosphate pyrophosphohydrolase [Paenibacillus nasutitermitis]|uniref:8-oxo-dGTP diphosphatase n=1 Tax=Paenibacillus nasutitermitis TaxID=1652958 RepID=A0A916ZIX5_9BACL|nr:(deoxy)nucleoside triphosphate pyrophosphohydrolase [Paenibacillus nasutitermitis]GGE00167.1 DNA mismatch repair protein MutT [Paenibacillus nasutitermitis]
MIRVAAAIIENGQRQLLIARRKKGKSQEGMWEFPGGKIEHEETAEECLKRELREEMNIEIEPYAYFGVNDHWYGETHIRLIAYRAGYVRGEIRLVDHDEYVWVNPRHFGEFTFAPADVRFVEMLYH